jgi:hypothetical protein
VKESELAGGDLDVHHDPDLVPAAQIPRAGWSSSEVVAVSPGGGLVVEGAVAEAAVEDGDESVGDDA